MTELSLTDLDNYIFEHCYPIGSVYITERSENPNVILAGGSASQWTKIQGRFIRATDDGVNVNTTGGSNSLSLTVDNLPAHKHTATTNSTGAHTHTRGTMNITGSVGQGYTTNGSINGGWHNHNNKGYGKGALYLSATSNGSSCTWSNYGDSGLITLDASKGWTGSTSSTGNHTHTVTIADTGSGTPFDNQPAYIAFNIWKRVS